MHSLIDAETVQIIRTTGNTSNTLPARTEVLDKYGLPYDQKADNVIITGCQILAGLPHVLKDLAVILDRGGLTYTFLSKEFCCGNNLYRPAISAKNEEALAECRILSKEFVGCNVQKAKELGAQRLIVFCSPCYPIYKHAFPEAQIHFYPHAIDTAISDLCWNGQIDYYPGCYRLHRRFSPAPMDLESANAVFSKIRGLSINRIGAPQCCYKPDGLAHMLGHVESAHMVHICTGCYFQALVNMPKERQVQVLMLPEFIRMVQDS